MAQSAVERRPFKRNGTVAQLTRRALGRGDGKYLNSKSGFSCNSQHCITRMEILANVESIAEHHLQPAWKPYSTDRLSQPRTQTDHSDVDIKMLRPACAFPFAQSDAAENVRGRKRRMIPPPVSADRPLLLRIQEASRRPHSPWSSYNLVHPNDTPFPCFASNQPPGCALRESVLFPISILVLGVACASRSFIACFTAISCWRQGRTRS